MIAVLLAVYTLTVSLLYAVIYATSPETAEGLIVFFVALLLIPAAVHDARLSRRRRR